MATARKLPSGNWRVQIYDGVGPSGKRRYRSFTAETKRAAELAAAEYSNGKRDSSDKTSLSLFDAYSKYIESKESILSPSTIMEYRRMQKNYLADLMQRDIHSLSQHEIQSAFNQEARTHSPKTLRNMHGLLSAVFSTFRPDFTLRTSLPQKRKTEIRIPTEQEILALYSLVKGTPMEVPFLLASQLGLRASEIAGLTYSCVDYEREEVRIIQARVRGESGPVVKAPKSYSGTRTIPCGKVILDAIGTGDPDSFVVSFGSGPITKRWRRIILKSGIKEFNFHALRHYFASQALLQGIPQKYIAEMMGHASEHMINTVYQHTFKDAKEQFSLQMKAHTNRLFEKVQHEMQHEI